MRRCLRPSSAAWLIGGSFLMFFLAAASCLWLVPRVFADTGILPLGATVSFTASSYTVYEADGIAAIDVVMNGTPAGPVSVNYATSDGTAVAGVNYEPASGTLTWQITDAGTTQTFFVTILDDGVVDPTLTVNLTLSNPVNATLTAPSTAVIDILDSDGSCGS